MKVMYVGGGVSYMLWGYGEHEMIARKVRLESQRASMELSDVHSPINQVTEA